MPLHRKDRTYRRGFTEEKDERMGCEQAIRAVSLDRRNRFLSNQDGQPERPYQSPHPEPVSPFPSHSPLNSNDSPKSQDKDEPKSEPHLSTLIDNIPTQ